MPGRRNRAREQATHDAGHLFGEYRALLRAQLPSHDRALIGTPAILAELHRLGIRRPNGGPLTQRILNRWRRDLGFPLLRGYYHAKVAVLSPAFSTTFAVTAWVLSRFCSADGAWFSVGNRTHPCGVGKIRPPGRRTMARIDLPASRSG